MKKSLLRCAFVAAVLFAAAADSFAQNSQNQSAVKDIEFFLDDIGEVKHVLDDIEAGVFQKVYNQGSDSIYSFFHRTNMKQAVWITPHQNEDGSFPDANDPKDIISGYITIQNGEPGSENFYISTITFKQGDGKTSFMLSSGAQEYNFNRL